MFKIPLVSILIAGIPASLSVVKRPKSVTSSSVVQSLTILFEFANAFGTATPISKFIISVGLNLNCSSATVLIDELIATSPKKIWPDGWIKSFNTLLQLLIDSPTFTTYECVW